MNDQVIFYTGTEPVSGTKQIYQVDTTFPYSTQQITSGAGNYYDPDYVYANSHDMIACSIDGDIWVFDPTLPFEQTGNLVALTNFNPDPNNSPMDAFNNRINTSGGNRVFRNQGDSNYYAVQYDGGTFKTYYMEACLGCFNDGADTKKDLVSSLMNWFTGSGSVADTTAPATPTLDYALAKYSPGSITLKWEAPGDDGWNGDNSSGYYDIRYRQGTWSNWNDLTTQASGEPTPSTTPKSSEAFTLSSLSTNVTYTFGLRTYDDSGNHSESNFVTVYLPDWSSAGCSQLASASLVCLVEWQDDDSNLPTAEWKTQLGANNIAYDFYQDELPADLSGYDLVMNIGGDWGAGTFDSADGMGILLYSDSYRQQIEDYVAAGGSVYFEHDGMHLRLELTIAPGAPAPDDLPWINNVLGTTTDNPYDYTDNYGTTAMAQLTWTNSGFGSQNYNYSGNPNGYGFFINTTTPDESYNATVAYNCNYGGVTGTKYQVTIYEPIAGSKRIEANMLINEISTSGDRAQWANDVISYYGLGAVPPDNCAPSRVDDLRASLSAEDLYARLDWTAPGDDTLIGAGLGACTLYDIRYSNARITDANWNSATQFTGEPTPQTYGSKESWKVALPSAGTWYFAMKSQDDVGLWSPLSNNASIYIPSSVPSPKVIVLDHNPSVAWWYKPYDGVRDDFSVNDRLIDPILVSLDNLGVAYDLYEWDFPPDDPGPTNPLLKYDVMFWSDSAFGPPSDPDTGCISYNDTWKVEDFLLNGGRLYQEGNFVGSIYGYAAPGDGLDVEGHQWKYFGITFFGYYDYHMGCEEIVGIDGTFTEGMVFNYDSNSPEDIQPFAFEISTQSRGDNAFYIFSSVNDPYYPDGDSPALEMAIMTANDTVGVKTVISNEPFGGITSRDGSFPNFRDELMRRILQFFDYGGVKVYEDKDPILYPKWNAAGNKVAFLQGVFGSADLKIVDNPGVSGTPTVHELNPTNIHHISSISWSPDGNYILYVSSDAAAGDLRIYRQPVSGGAATMWQPDMVNARFVDPDWTTATNQQTGKEMIAVSNLGDIAVYNADGSGTNWGFIQITDFQNGNYYQDYTVNPKCYQPKWSPDNLKMVFVYRPAGTGVGMTGIYILDGVQDIIKGTGGAGVPPTTITDSRITAIYPSGFYPAWSPSWTLDGNYVAFCVDRNKAFDNNLFATDADTQIKASNFDVLFRDVTLQHNFQSIQDLKVPEGFEEWTYSGGDKYVYSERTSENVYGLMLHGPEALEDSGITRGTGDGYVVVKDHSKSYVKMNLKGYGNVKLAIKTPVRIKAAGMNGLNYIGEAREIKTYPVSDKFINGAELVIHYTKAEVKNINEKFLKIYFYDKTKRNWMPVDGSVVTKYSQGGYVSAKVYKQGTYAIFTGRKQSAYTDLSKMRVFPNPFRPNDGKLNTGVLQKGIVIDKLPDDVEKISVFNIAGDLVATMDNAVKFFEKDDPEWYQPYLNADANGAIAVWNGNNDKDNRVASGIYLISIKTKSGEKELKKVAIIW